jgi:DNA-binding XRE family transcriptional regulator
LGRSAGNALRSLQPSAQVFTRVKDLSCFIKNIHQNKIHNYLGYLIPWYLSRQTSSIASMAKPSKIYSKDKFLVDIGMAIRDGRSNLKMSQESLAEASGLDRSYMGGIERGEHNFSIINLKRISKALGIAPSELLKRSEL